MMLSLAFMSYEGQQTSTTGVHRVRTGSKMRGVASLAAMACIGLMLVHEVRCRYTVTSTVVGSLGGWRLLDWVEAATARGRDRFRQKCIASMPADRPAEEKYWSRPC